MAPTAQPTVPKQVGTLERLMRRVCLSFSFFFDGLRPTFEVTIAGDTSADMEVKDRDGRMLGNGKGPSPSIPFCCGEGPRCHPAERAALRRFYPVADCQCCQPIGLDDGKRSREPPEHLFISDITVMTFPVPDILEPRRSR